MDVYKHVKKKLIAGTLEYPELGVYENFLKMNSEHYLQPDHAELQLSKTFGYSVIPKDLDRKIHSGLKVDTLNENGEITHTHNCLPHQCYLHDMLMKIWTGKATAFRLTPILEKHCIVKFK